MNDKVDYKIK